MREKRRLKVFQNRVLKIIGPKRYDVTREWRKLHNEKLNDLYSSRNIARVIKSKRMRWAGHVAVWVDWRGIYRDLLGNPEGKRSLGRPRPRWEDNIQMDLQEVRTGVWIGSSKSRQGQVADICECRNELSCSIKCGEFLD